MHEEKRVEGAVSLWIGVSPSRDALENYVEMDYSTNNISHLSRLARDFRTGWYDHDFMEADMPKRYLPGRGLSLLVTHPRRGGGGW